MARQAKRPGAANDNRLNDDAVDAGDADCAEERAPREVASLDFPSQFLVWGIRCWVQAFKTKEEFHAVTQQAFTRFGLIGSAFALDGVMGTLAAAASRPIDVRCAKCRYLSPDEASLLDAVAAVQAEHFFLATIALRKLMPGTAARLALAHAVDLARDLARADMILRRTSPGEHAPHPFDPDAPLAVPARHRLH
jgi:hypothetical protein